MLMKLVCLLCMSDCCYYNYMLGVFLKHFVFNIANMLKSKHLPGVKSPRLEYKELTLNSTFT